MKNQQNPTNGYAPFTMGKPQEGEQPAAPAMPQMPYAFAPKEGEQPTAPAMPQMPYAFAPAAATKEEEK